MLMVCLHLFRPNLKAQAAAGTWWRYMPERAKERTVQVPAAAPHTVLEDGCELCHSPSCAVRSTTSDHKQQSLSRGRRDDHSSM